MKQTSRRKEALRREIAILHREMQQLPATLDMDENFKRMRHVRYADDFLICVIGSKEDCVKAKGDIKTFLQDTLKLELSDEKTLITNSHDVQPNFSALMLQSAVRTRRERISEESPYAHLTIKWFFSCLMRL